MNDSEDRVVVVERKSRGHRLTRIETEDEFLRGLRPRRDGDRVILRMGGVDVPVTVSDIQRMLRATLERMAPDEIEDFLVGVGHEPRPRSEDRPT